MNGESDVVTVRRREKRSHLTLLAPVELVVVIPIALGVGLVFAGWRLLREDSWQHFRNGGTFHAASPTDNPENERRLVDLASDGVGGVPPVARNDHDPGSDRSTAGPAKADNRPALSALAERVCRLGNRRN